MRAVSITRKIKRLQAMAGDERRLLGEAALLLVLLRLGLRLLPFQTVRGLLARFEGNARSADASLSDSETTGRVVWAVDAASRTLSLTCLPRALAAHTLLARRGLASELRIGVTRTPGSPLQAHAWVEDASGILIGNLPNLAHFKPFAHLNGRRV